MACALPRPVLESAGEAHDRQEEEAALEDAGSVAVLAANLEIRAHRRLRTGTMQIVDPVGASLRKVITALTELAEGLRWEKRDGWVDLSNVAAMQMWSWAEIAKGRA